MVTWPMMISVILIFVLNLMGQVIMMVVMRIARNRIVTWFKKHDYLAGPTTQW
jgi:hypothetical protein